MEPDCSVEINETTNLADNIPTWVGVWVGVGGGGKVENDTVTRPFSIQPSICLLFGGALMAQSEVNVSNKLVMTE